MENKELAARVAALARAVEILVSRVDVTELLARAVIATHPDPAALEAAFVALAIAVDDGMPSAIHGQTRAWDHAVGEVKVWLRQAQRPAG